MSIQSGSKLKNARPVASIPASPIAPASTVNEISLLERVSILASILLSLKQSVASTAAVAQTAAAEATGEDGASSQTGAAGEVVISPPQAIEIARLPERLSTDSHSPAQGSANPAGFTEHRLAAEAGADPIAPPPQADALLKPIAHRGSSTSPSVLKIDVVDDKAGSAPLSLEKLVVATPVSDVIVSSIPKTTFVFTGTPGPDNFDIFVGTGRGNTIDLSQLTDLGPPAKPQPAGAGDEVKQDPAAANGFLIDLAATNETVNTADGPVSVQVWKLDENGKATTAVAHLENIDNVVASIGNDIVKGNGNANTFTYTAADGTHDGQNASYGFDIYYGGPSDATGDLGDTADFSRLGTQASAAAAAPGSAPILLPHDAKGIIVDLAQSVTIATVDPMTGDTTTVTGSLVSTIGGAEQTDLALLAWSAAPAGGEAHATIEDIIGAGGSENTDLALLAWTAPPDGSEGHSTIEHIVTSGGADAVWGDGADNTVVVSGDGTNGPVYFDGRGSNDTIDFSRLELPDANSGIEVHLNQTTDGVTDPTGATQSDVTQVSLVSGQGGGTDDVTPVAQVRDVENVVGSCGNDIIEGDRNDNVMTGGGGSDTFAFSDVAVVDGRGITDVGHDIIRDFRNGGIADDDHLVFDARIFNFHDGSSLDWLQQLLNNNQIRDDDEGTIIWIDDNNSITLQNYALDDYSGHGLGLAAYSSWIVFV